MTRPSPPPDWQLPAGVNRGLWDYLHSEDLARGYDRSLAGSSLFSIDQAFVERHCPPPGRLIDLGCGTGRLLITLAKRGYETTGVDLSPEMLRVAAEKATLEKLQVSLIQANLTDLDGIPNATFDYAACLFSTLGMVLGADYRRRVLAHTLRILKPGGTFILHVHNRWFSFWNPDGRRWLGRDILGRSVGERGDRLMPTHQGIAGLTLHLFTRSEIRNALKGAGFQLLEVKPISLSLDGRLSAPWWFGWLRAYGYLIVATKAK